MSSKQSYSQQGSPPGQTPGPTVNRFGRPHGGNDFRTFYEDWCADVARWLRAFGAPPADRDDLLQEVFVVVHRRLPDFDGRNPAGWLYRITARQVRDFRRQRWFKNIFRRSDPPGERLPAPGPSPVLRLETREKRELLAKLLEKIGRPLRETFVLFEIEGYSGEEIAALQGISINTVRARIRRARKKLTALLRAGDGERDGQSG
jgi:RNA polymerase sigma-70 factor (ECF subfamily)